MEQVWRVRLLQQGAFICTGWIVRGRPCRPRPGAGHGLVLVSVCLFVCASILRKDACCVTCARVSARSLPAGVRAQQGDMQYVAMSRKVVVSIENHLQLLGDEDFHTCKVVTWSAAHTHTRALTH